MLTLVIDCRRRRRVLEFPLHYRVVGRIWPSPSSSPYRDTSGCYAMHCRFHSV